MLCLVVCYVSVACFAAAAAFTRCADLCRRIVWNFFRLENEHLNNCGEFRAVRDISITPIDHSDQVLLEKMMDEEDGVTNRREKEGRRRFNLRYELSGRVNSCSCEWSSFFHLKQTSALAWKTIKCWLRSCVKHRNLLVHTTACPGWDAISSVLVWWPCSLASFTAEVTSS